MAFDDIKILEKFNGYSKASAYITSLLLKKEDVREVLAEVLEILGRASGSSCSYWFERHVGASESIFMKQSAEWHAEGIDPQFGNSWLQNLADRDSYPRWHKKLSTGRIILGCASNFSGEERAILEAKGIKCILIIPIVIRGNFEGFFGFDNCVSNELWRDIEVNLLCSVVGCLAKAFENEKCQKDKIGIQEQLQYLQKMESVGELASGVFHNLRNILAGIITNSQFVSMKYKDNYDIHNNIDNIINQANSGCDLIDDLLQYSLKGTKKEKSIFNLSEVLQETYQIISGIFDKKIEIKKQWPELLLIEGDRPQLSQVFINIFTNARDSMIDGGLLQIEAGEEGDRIAVIVSDTGYGIEEENLKRIFDPFFTTKDAGKGTGLGLSTVRNILEDHHCEIKIHSKPGLGTSFEIYFPLSKTQELSEERILPQVISGKGHKILIVDDDKTFLGPMEEALRKIGYKTESADSGDSSIEKYIACRPDVVLMDRNMPGMGGLTICKHILSLDPEAKIVIVSGYDEEDPDGVNGKIKSLIKDYIVKPFNIAEISQILAKVMEK